MPTVTQRLLSVFLTVVSEMHSICVVSHSFLFVLLRVGCVHNETIHHTASEMFPCTAEMYAIHSHHTST